MNQRELENNLSRTSTGSQQAQAEEIINVRRTIIFIFLLFVFVFVFFSSQIYLINIYECISFSS